MFKFIFFKLVELYNYFFRIFEINVYKVGLSYKYDGKLRTKFLDSHPFWINEKRYWLNKNEEEYHWADVTHIYRRLSKPPRGVSDILFKIKYWYKNGSYVCMTDNPRKVLDNSKPKVAKFSMPIKEVQLLDKDGNKVRNVTKKFMKLYGPSKDFHNETKYKVYEMFSYDDYEDVEVIDILNNSKKVSKHSTLHQFL